MQVHFVPVGKVVGTSAVSDNTLLRHLNPKCAHPKVFPTLSPHTCPMGPCFACCYRGISVGLFIISAHSQTKTNLSRGMKKMRENVKPVK